MIIVLGKSEATLTMIADNLKSIGSFCQIKIINNLKLPYTKEYTDSFFEYFEEYELKTKEGNFIIGTTKPENKIAIHKYFSIEDSKFINVVHKSSEISSTVYLKNGIIINSLVSIAAFSEIGNHVTINRNSSIGHHTIIEDFVAINPGCNIAGNCLIGEGTLIGMGTNVRDGVKIGKNCTIGMGSTVLKDIPDNSKVFGLIK